ncbi:uncharacterized protein LOC132725602 [Ruditapes philippinarum]|uniref:uncharacterized protein LOC132725602 n=1 Tax=Ruditapes philippinarum TaxID=129788 RepID=UPI00295AF48A|nr:uncharacterized protein LOC132725602 [Ruditapes philippinarum]
MAVIVVLVVLMFISNLQSVVSKINEPDYDSGWVPISSGTKWADRLTHVKSFNHGFEELPILVDVQVKAIDGPNKDFVLPASGHSLRDDDRIYSFGQVVYIYNSTTILVSPPIRNNGKLGYCIYTGTSPYWEGPAEQTSLSALVRARAWRSSSLPRPDFIHKGSKLTASTGKREDSYLSVQHGLSEYPALVVSRIKFPEGNLYPNFYADSVGAGSMIYTKYADEERNGYVIYGFNNSSIRVWAPSRSWGFLFFGGEGGAGFNYRVTSAYLELYAWRERTVIPTETLKKTLSPERISSSDLTIDFRQTYQTDNILIKTWVEAVDGVNAGYRFIGGGALAYDEYVVSEPCSYGGLVYGYSNHSVRLWKPGKATNGALICLQEKLAEGTNSQASSRGVATVMTWQIGKVTFQPSQCKITSMDMPMIQLGIKINIFMNDFKMNTDRAWSWLTVVQSHPAGLMIYCRNIGHTDS